MGTLILFILMMGLFLFFGFLGIAGKLLGGVFNMFKGLVSKGDSGRSSDDYVSEDNHGAQTETSVRRMKRFKSWAEDTSYEESVDEKVEMEQPVREEMMNK
ncbi:MAG: hypothetical protein IKN77_10500 [Paludibacteraceae bacterium]|nr:hypothetical protein [Paludibacteraceae bacterium]